jgi:DNA topoisomerase-3
VKKLVLAEKPGVARDYAEILGCKEKKEGYIEGENYIITWAFGHLFTLKEPGEYNENYKKWMLEDLPIVPGKFEIKPNPSGAKQ